MTLEIVGENLIVNGRLKDPIEYLYKIFKFGIMDDT